MADTKKPSPTVKEFALWQLERIAADALAKDPKCVKGRRVDIERLMQEGFDIQIGNTVQVEIIWRVVRVAALERRIWFVPRHDGFLTNSQEDTAAIADLAREQVCGCALNPPLLRFARNV